MLDIWGKVCPSTALPNCQYQITKLLLRRYYDFPGISPNPLAEKIQFVNSQIWYSIYRCICQQVYYDPLLRYPNLIPPASLAANGRVQKDYDHIQFPPSINTNTQADIADIKLDQISLFLFDYINKYNNLDKKLDKFGYI